MASPALKSHYARRFYFISAGESRTSILDLGCHLLVAFRQTVSVWSGNTAESCFCSFNEMLQTNQIKVCSMSGSTGALCPSNTPDLNDELVEQSPDNGLHLIQVYWRTDKTRTLIWTHYHIRLGLISKVSPCPAHFLVTLKVFFVCFVFYSERWPSAEDETSVWRNMNQLAVWWPWITIIPLIPLITHITFWQGA